MIPLILCSIIALAGVPLNAVPESSMAGTLTFLRIVATSKLKTTYPIRRLFPPLHQFLESNRNLHVLLNGESIRRKLSARIGDNHYIITNLLTYSNNVYFYQGHLEGKPEEVILLKVFTNDARDGYQRELMENSKERIILDRDDQNSMLVEKSDRSFIVNLGDGSQYVLTEALALNPSRSVFVGHKANDDPDNSVIVKIYDLKQGILSYGKEKECMERLGRLIAYDGLKLVLVEKYISGKLLQQFLLNDSVKRRMVFAKCQKLVDNFHKNIGMSHNDIHPGNIIVKENGDVDFIDFSKSKKFSSDPIEASKERLSDMNDLIRIFRMHISRLHSAPV